jgi:hypothetical protein
MFAPSRSGLHFSNWKPQIPFKDNDNNEVVDSRLDEQEWIVKSADFGRVNKVKEIAWLRAIPNEV